MNLLTTRQVAAEFGISKRRVIAIAAERGVKPAKVEPISGAFLWRRSQLKALRPGPVGRPPKRSE